ncbi:MAG TPA: ABC transporter substrate-binding protein [Stellaceae bacterium]|nr:ABC transporter substrate-binding protein [Stellaceae bacterium]
MTTRRKLLKGVAATGAALALPPFIATGRAAEQVGIVLPLGFSIDFFDAMNAYSGGHYAREGIDAKIIGANTGVQMTQLVVSGQAVFGRGSPPDQVRAVAAKQAAPLAIASICQGCNFRVFSPKAKPVLVPKDFKGKVVGLITAASPTGIYLDVMLAQAGLSGADVERQVTGGTPGAIEILKQGRVDCFISTLSVKVALERAKEPVEVWNPDKYLPLPGQNYLAMPETIQAKPDLVLRFLRAIKASALEMMAGPIAPLLERAAKDFDIPGVADRDGNVAYLETAITEMWLSEGRENLLLNLPRRWDAGLAALREAKLVDLTDSSVLYTNKFIEQVMKG